MTAAQPRLSFDETAHQYRLGDSPLPSVTQVLSSVGRLKNGEWTPLCDTRWVKDDTARNFGTAFHRAASYMLHGEEVEVPESMVPWVEQFKRWRKEHDWLVPAVDHLGTPLVEYSMCHQGLGYCGTPDLVAAAGDGCPYAFRNCVVVCDWKTATAEQDYWAYQTAAYAEMVKAVFPLLCARKRVVTMAVMFGETTYKCHSHMVYNGDWAKFVSALNILKG